MSLGHGQPGLVDYLRTYSDLVDDAGGSLRPYLDFMPGKEMPAGSWLTHSGATKVQRAQFLYDGLLRDIVGVDTSVGELARVETMAACVATAGTYYCNVETATYAPVGWDDGDTTVWDEETDWWDRYPPMDLYVHLAGDVDPNGQTVVALLGFHYGTAGEVHPILGADIFAGAGEFESLAGWTEVLSGAGWSSALDSAFVKSGTSSLKLVSTGAATGNASRAKDVATVVGAIYRLSGYYRVDEAFSANLTARLLVSDTSGAVVVDQGGRDTSASGEVALRLPYGEWRAFHFDFVAFATTTRVRLQLRAPSSAGAGQVNFDRVNVQRVFRYAFYEPRLDAGSLAEVECGSRSIFFGPQPIGIGAAALLDDGTTATIFAQLLTTGKAARVATGGVLGDGQAVYRDDWRNQFYGISRDLWASDDRITIELDDPTTILLDVEAPRKRLTAVEYPDMDPNAEGEAAPLVLGSFTTSFQGAMVPVRIGVTADGYGIYKLADAEGTPGLLADFLLLPKVYVYPSQQAREHAIEFPSDQLAGTGYDHDFDLALGTLTILKNVADFERDSSGDTFTYRKLDFDLGAGALVADVTTSLSAEGQADLLRVWFLLAAGLPDIPDPEIQWSYSTTTHKFSTVKKTGTYNLLCKTGANAALTKAFWERLGFDVSSDKTGALNYTAENAVFSSPEEDHVLAVVMNGISDSAAGTYTGSASALISKPCDVFNFVLQFYGGVPASRIDSASLVASRINGFGAQLCRVYERQPRPLRALFAEIAASGMADIVVDGAGTWYFRSYSSTVPSTVIDLYDRDIISFRLGRRSTDVFARAEVTSAKRPRNSATLNKQYAWGAGVATKYGRQETLRVQTALMEEAGYPDTLGVALSKLGAAAPRVVELSARGKLVDALRGDKLRITRSRAFDPTGALAAVVFRILYLRRNLLTGVTTCLAVEDVHFT